jgi:hypothetical protein
MVGMFVCLCLTRKKPSEQEFFVPAGTDLGVKLLSSYKAQKQIGPKYGPTAVNLLKCVVVRRRCRRRPLSSVPIEFPRKYISYIISESSHVSTLVTSSHSHSIFVNILRFAGSMYLKVHTTGKA